MRLTIVSALLAASFTLSAANSWGPWGSPPTGPSNNGKTCTVRALGNKKDDTRQILDAFKDCNNGGTVVFLEGQNYWIATKLNPVISDVTVEWKGVWTAWILSKRT
jgi:galacturan 1,4-alpha-galacturonidase